MTENLENLLAELWLDVKRDFNHPVVDGAELVDSLGVMDTASFNFDNRRVNISRAFLQLLQPRFSSRESLELILKHEVGHWAFFPRELAHNLYLLAEADALGKEKATSLHGLYSDIVNELTILQYGIGGREFADFRAYLAELALQKKGRVSGILQHLLAALYGTAFKELGHLPSLTPEEKQYFEKIKDIPFRPSSLSGHVASFYRFYKALEPLLPDPPCAHLGVGDPLGKIGDIPSAELDRALSDILQEKGPAAYRRSKEYLKKVRPDFKDPFSSTASGKHAGLEKGDFKLHDDLIPFYKRWAATFGTYIAKRPMEKDCQTSYTSDRKEYEIGDPLHKIDIFGSRGIIGIPGITKLFREEEGVMPAIEWSIPHALIGIDSSGSMTHPRNVQGAVQVLAAALLGKNYHANGAYVGGWNFSTDIVFLPPQRDLDVFYSLICGYWGGGTHLNTEKLFRFLEAMKFEERSKMYHLNEQKDLSALVPEEKRKEFIEKSLTIPVERVKLQCRNLDNILITDGHIANAKEVLSYLSSLGEITRNFVFLTDSEKYDEWSKINLPHTFVYPATNSKDLIALALGKSRALVGSSSQAPSAISYTSTSYPLQQ